MPATHKKYNLKILVRFKGINPQIKTKEKGLNFNHFFGVTLNLIFSYKSLL